MAILIGLLPALLAIWALVRLDSPGPAIFSQVRLGRHETPFTLFKFRTMEQDTISVGTHEIGASSVTSFGRFLRKTKLDELPQAINLLRGEMTLVGPRPCLPLQQELILARRSRGVFASKPGITGYAQIRGIDMSEPQLLARNDGTYLRLRSLALDARILAATLLGRGAGDRVRAEDAA
jgi:lipopolysaccharide/colanic/teichoic acid biosynthesis glycosyltransferase